MKCLLLICAVAPFVFAGCARDPKPGMTTDMKAMPSGPCRDDANLENGRCTPRFPGDYRLPATPPTTSTPR